MNSYNFQCSNNTNSNVDHSICVHEQVKASIENVAQMAMHNIRVRFSRLHGNIVEKGVVIKKMATRKSSKDGNKSDGSNDDSTNSGITLAQKSDGKTKGQRGQKHKFKKILKLSPSTTPEPVRLASGFNISVTEDDKSEHGDILHRGKWGDSVLRSSEHSENSPCNPSQTNVSVSPPTCVHVTDQYRPVLQRGPDYNTLNDLVSS